MTTLRCASNGQPAANAQARGESCPPITDSTEPGGQGQRCGERFLWIREAGIRVLLECPKCGAEFGVFQEFWPVFAQVTRLFSASECWRGRSFQVREFGPGHTPTLGHRAPVPSPVKLEEAPTTFCARFLSPRAFSFDDSSQFGCTSQSG
jgi:hypothetical protein